MEIKDQLDIQAMYARQAAEQQGTPAQTEADQGETLGQPPTREEIAKLKKVELIGWLEAHGVEKPTGTVEELRAALTAAMFVEA